MASIAPARTVSVAAVLSHVEFRTTKTVNANQIARRQPAAHVCDCGNRAARRRAGSWICLRCYLLEVNYYGLDAIGRRKNAHAGRATR